MEMSLINVEKENVEEEKEQGNEKCFSFFPQVNQILLAKLAKESQLWNDSEINQ